MRYSVDIESLGTGADAAIIQIGVAAFTKHEVISSTRWDVEPDRGARLDTTTVRWWMEQVRRGTPFPGQGEPIEHVLGTALPRHLTNVEEVWGYPSTFDLTIITESCRRLGLPMPWKFTKGRCLKTLVKLAADLGISVQRPVAGTAHDAESDAVAQAEWIIALRRALCDSCSTAS
jgi:hypothetical protein